MTASRTFTAQDQQAFARVSGDSNPLHVDPVFARRSQVGVPVVHGLHLALWAFDAWLHQQPAGTAGLVIHAFRASFVRAVPIESAVRWGVASYDTGRLELVIHQAEHATPAARILVEFGEADARRDAFSHADSSSSAQGPRSWALHDISNAAGRFELHVRGREIHAQFPALASRFPILEIAALANTSRLVGMECPGLHSMFLKLDLKRGGGSAGSSMPAVLQYRVDQVDQRFGLVRMVIASGGLEGSVSALLRPAPQQQLPFVQILSRVAGAEYAGQRALVVGGSRGLGEVAAKLLAAGGAQVRITYAKGRVDAERVVAEINGHDGSAQGRCGCFELDVLQSPDRWGHLMKSWQPTHLYYFATPAIFLGTRSEFSTELFNRFCAYYVDGFLNVFQAVRSDALTGVLYPSSVAIDEMPLEMAEYAAAKSAAETLCRWLGRVHPGVRWSVPRLPRVPTDQTASMVPTRSAEALAVLIDVLRPLHASPAPAP